MNEISKPVDLKFSFTRLLDYKIIIGLKSAGKLATSAPRFETIEQNSSLNLLRGSKSSARVIRLSADFPDRNSDGPKIRSILDIASRSTYTYERVRIVVFILKFITKINNDP